MQRRRPSFPSLIRRGEIDNVELNKQHTHQVLGVRGEGMKGNLLS